MNVLPKTIWLTVKPLSSPRGGLMERGASLERGLNRAVTV